MMTNVLEINEILVHNTFNLGLTVGLTKAEIENVLGKEFGNADVITPDLTSYYVELKNGILVTILFDTDNICYEIDLSIEENKNTALTIRVKQHLVEINENISFGKLVETLFCLNLRWEFDNERIYFQTVCLRLQSGLRMYYAFGDKSKNDYGLFSIKSILEGHKFSALRPSQHTIV